MKQAIIVGQSHTVCISAAAIRQPDRARAINIQRLRSGDKAIDDAAVSVDEAAALIKASGSDCGVFLSILGGFHNAIALLRYGPDFDFVEDAAQPHDDGTVGVPFRAIASIFDDQLDGEIVVKELCRAAPGPVFMLACPPPKMDNDYMMGRLLERQKKFYRGKDVLACGINRPALRRKLWQLEGNRIAAWASGLGAHYLPPPALAFDADGYLDARLYADDATHANIDYGALVLDQVSAMLDTDAQVTPDD